MADWMPGIRAHVLEMAQNWRVILDDKGGPWVPVQSAIVP
jgi:hypothetical protein